MESLELNIAWPLIKRKIFPPEVLPYVMDAVCKERLQEFLDAGYGPQGAVDRLVALIVAEPFNYVDFPRGSSRRESPEGIKGSLGHDLFNVQPRRKRRNARIVEISGEIEDLLHVGS